MLTDRKIQSLKPGEKPTKVPDTPNLYLLVQPTGSKLWRMRYTLGGKEKLLALGAYPDLGLADARSARDEAMTLVKAGKDPVAERARAKRAEVNPDTTFESVARKWFDTNKQVWRERHTYDVVRSLERDIFPILGAKQIGAITTMEMAHILQKIAARPAVETAHRIRQRCSAVFGFGAGMGLCQTDPAGIVKRSLAPVAHGRQPALVELDQVRAILTACSTQPAHPLTKLALRFIALTAVRPGELRAASWEMFEGLDTETPIWMIPAEVMKMKRPHVVPLSRQAVEVLAMARRYSGYLPFVFPNSRFPQRMMCENALGYLMNRAGYHHQHTAHGWRAAFSTIMNEKYPADRMVIDLMLAHVPKDKVEAAYNRSVHRLRRAALAQAWADMLTEGLPSPDEMCSGRRRLEPAGSKAGAKLQEAPYV